MEKTNNVRYEFFKYQSSTLGGSFTNTLVFNNPLSIEFILTGTALGNGSATINNTYFLDTINKFITGTAINPYQLKLSNQYTEIDKTTYTIQLFNVCDLTVICKFRV